MVVHYLARLIPFILMIISTYNGQILNFSQNDFQATTHHMVLTYVNRSFYNYINISNTRYNRTTRTFNFKFELKSPMDNDYLVILQAYKFVDNQYKLYAPLRISLRFCDILKSNAAGVRDIFKSSHMPTECPIPKGKYIMKYIVLNFNKLPPGMPLGDFKVVAQHMHKNLEVLNYAWYGSVKERQNLKTK